MNLKTNEELSSLTNQELEQYHSDLQEWCQLLAVKKKNALSMVNHNFLKTEYHVYNTIKAKIQAIDTKIESLQARQVRLQEKQQQYLSRQQMFLEGYVNNTEPDESSYILDPEGTAMQHLEEVQQLIDSRA